MATFTLTVNVDSADYAALKAAKYKLCIAKKVDNTYNTVWRGDTFFAYNQFQWTSKYQVFGTQTYADGALVVASTDAPDIQFGQTALLDEDGTMHNASGTPNPRTGTFGVQNDYGGIRIGVNGWLGDRFSPIFVTPQTVVNGPVTLKPVESVMVWFDQQHRTSTIITESVSDTIEVDFTGGIVNRSVTYASSAEHPGRGGWSLDGLFQLSSTYHPQTKRFAVERPSASLLLKMAKIISKQSKDAARADGAAIKASLEFNEQDAQAGAVEAFKEYVEDARPDGLSEWNVSANGNVVQVQVALEGDDVDLGKATRKIPYKYLSVLHGWTGAQYKKLTFEAPQA
ncbi:hypothetical protein BV20DRAFT_962666 [Pilatotrama ljubarskyi]|nr:hypothetical protein BV20DRAFT_962666 [Pilatotrama ljubarskyi]